MPILTNVRRERFAQFIADGHSQAEAYRRAGYSDATSNASRLSANDSIHARVRELRIEAAEAAGLTREYVIARLMRVADRAMQAVPVVNGKGEPTGEYRYDGAAANRSLELLGKHLGMFVDRAEVREVQYEISAEPLSLDEWLEQHGKADVAH